MRPGSVITPALTTRDKLAGAAAMALFELRTQRDRTSSLTERDRLRPMVEALEEAVSDYMHGEA